MFTHLSLRRGFPSPRFRGEARTDLVVRAGSGGVAGAAVRGPLRRRLILSRPLTPGCRLAALPARGARGSTLAKRSVNPIARRGGVGEMRIQRVLILNEPKLPYPARRFGPLGNICGSPGPVSTPRSGTAMIGAPRRSFRLTMAPRSSR